MDECQVFHLPKGACQIQRVIFNSNLVPFVVKRKIPKLQDGFRLFEPMTKPATKKRGPSHECEVKSLLDLCIDFVSHNAEHLESLEGFPLQIGTIIWDKVLHLGKLDRAGLETAQILESFVSGYSSEMLGGCKISSLIVLNNFEDEIKILVRHCTSLALSNCRLDENHDLLVELPKICQQLTHLDLSRNKLSSASLRLMFGVPGQERLAFPALKYLNISFNAKVTLKGVARYVANRVGNLEQITLSAKNIGEIKQNLGPSWRLNPVSKIIDIQTNGLGAKLIERWMSRIESEKNAKIQKLQNSISASKSFYGIKDVDKVTIVTDELDKAFTIEKHEPPREPECKRPRLQKRTSTSCVTITDEEDENFICQIYR